MKMEPNQEYTKTRSAASLIVALLILFSSIPSFSATCTFESSNTSQFSCANASFPFKRENTCFLSGYQSGNRCYFKAVIIGYAASNDDCLNWTTYCANSSTICDQNPSLESCKPKCDSTKWTCTTSTENSAETTESTEINCINGTCYGGTYCTYQATQTTTCVNECGTSTTSETTSNPIRFEGKCNDVLTDQYAECLPETYCTSGAGSYMLFKMCPTGVISNVDPAFVPRSVGGGRGTCKGNGYEEYSPDSSGSGSGSGSADSVLFSQDCLLYGIGCPEKDTTDYSSPGFRSPENGCTCQKYDGLTSVSNIVCPDGSQSIFYGSCDDWGRAFSSSSAQSSASEVGSSDSEGGGNSSALVGDWATYSQAEDIKGALGVVVSGQQTANVHLNGIRSGIENLVDGLSGMTTNGAGFMDYGEMSVDSVDVPKADTLSPDSILKLFADKNTLIDTIADPKQSGCLVCTIRFSSPLSKSITDIPVQTIDLGNMFGFNLCKIFSTIFTLLCGIMEFIISARLIMRSNNA